MDDAGGVRLGQRLRHLELLQRLAERQPSAG